MAQELSTLVNALVLGEGETVAVFKPEVAKLLHEGIRLDIESRFGPFLANPLRPESGRYMVLDTEITNRANIQFTDHGGNQMQGIDNLLAGNMYFGVFKEIGYVDLIMDRGMPSLVGLVHVPQPLADMVSALKGGGEEGLAEFYQEFCKETEGQGWKGNTWDLKNHKSNLSFEGSSSRYYWKLEKGKSGVFQTGNPNALPEQIREFEAAVKNFIGRLDQYVHFSMNTGRTLNHDLAKERYERMLKGGALFKPGI